MFPSLCRSPRLIPAPVLCWEGQQQRDKVMQPLEVVISILSDCGAERWMDKHRGKKKSWVLLGAPEWSSGLTSNRHLKWHTPLGKMQEIQQHIICWKWNIYFLNVALSENQVFKISSNVCFVVVGTQHSTPCRALNHFVWMQKPSLLCWIERPPEKPECEKKSNSWKFQPETSSFPRPVCFGLPLPFLSLFL